MENEDSNLEAIKAKMTPSQRSQMAELLAAELKKRNESKKAHAQQIANAEKSSVRNSRFGSTLSKEQFKEVHSETSQNIRNSRIKEIDEQLFALRNGKKSNSVKTDKNAPRWGGGVFTRIPFRSAILVGGILIFGFGKILFATGIVNATIDRSEKKTMPARVELEHQDNGLKAYKDVQESPLTEPTIEQIHPVQKGHEYPWSVAEKTILTQLDSRRVELEKRRMLLDSREKELIEQEREIASKLVELKSVARKLSEFRKERNHAYEARLEQLANVYGSMAPKEAAPLIAKLNEPIALALLQRMPGKRMGQILSLMPSERAIELTMSLTDRNM